MSAATKSSRRRMGLTTLISAIFIVASLVWATYNFVIVQSGSVRQYDPHYEYDDIPPWPYDINWASGVDWRTYQNIPLDVSLPQTLLDQWDQVMFTVGPADPPQLWRTGAYNSYNGSDWGKTIPGTRTLSSSELIPLGSAPNQVYTVALNVTAGAAVGAVELPTLFPYLRIIEDSFMTWSFDTSGNPYPDPGRLISYELRTDDYGTLLFSPFIQGETGEQVVVSYNLSFDIQDMNNIVTNALPESAVVGMNEYLNYPALTPEVIANISQFSAVGSNAYEKAMAVQLYFQSTFQIILDFNTRPPQGQEVTDWFLERGGGLPMDFATAYCVFMRYLGIPSRLAMGYAVGDRDPVLDLRTLRVRHMSFWSEVWIPLAGGGGEWIQVIPATLPSDMGGDEDPTNTPNPNVELLVWPTNGQPWEQIGTPFQLSAAIFVDNVLVTTPETISFVDETDSVFVGTSITGPIANIMHTFPSDATVDYHIFAATWTTSTLSITNRTSVFAVGTPSPFSESTPPTVDGGFVLSETIQLNVSQGLDTYVTYWEDTVHVYGTMKVGGVPVNSSKYDNRNIGIYWDNTFMGNATIDEFGYYELNVYVDPLDLAAMTVGTHEVWSWYLGDWDQYGIPRLNEARSANNSTISVWGRVGFLLDVSPTDVSAGQTIYYDGVAYLLNGTTLPLGQQVGVFFHSQANTTVGVNSTGGFIWSYTIPVTQSDGTYFAYANWSSPWPLIEGNWSYYIPINVGSSGTHLTIDPLWDPLYVAVTYTINGFLTHVSNGTGIANRLVDIYWNNGTTNLIGSVLTNGSGYYELNYTVLVGDEGPIEFWSNFTSLEPTLASCESVHVFTNVKKWDTSLDPIFVTPDPVYLLQPIDIQGNLTLPEIPWNLANEWVDFYLQNSTGVFYIGSIMTNSTGGYFYQYTIPIGQAAETVYIWASYTSPYINVYDGESFHEPLDVQATGTLISIQEDFSYYYVNETIFLYGNLRFSNGTPIQFETVYIHWVNASGTFVFTEFTDAFGDYSMTYLCFPNQDEPGMIDVYVNWTSWSVLYDDAFSSIAPQIQLDRYSLEISLTDFQLYVDEINFDIPGTLTYLGGTPPIRNDQVYLYYWNGTDWEGPYANDLTDSSGNFLLSSSFVSYTDGVYTFGVYYPAPDLLHWAAFQTIDITRVKYAINLDVTINPNPVMQNGTLQIHVHAYFAHNGTDLSGESVSLYWNNGTLPLPWLGNVVLDGTGQADFFYSKMDWDTVRTGIEVYGYYAGTVFFGSNESVHNILTLNQWQTSFTGLNIPVLFYRIGETVVVTGNLEYVAPILPYASATVELTMLGTTRSIDVTASDGSFTLSWTIPGTVTDGSYDLYVEYNSPYPWIADTSSFVATIQISAPGYLWPAFNVAPTTVYLDQVLTISGTVTWDNGTPYANSPLDIYWGDYSSTANTIIVDDFITDGTGNFIIRFDVPDDLGLLTYVQHVWAYIDPVGYATFGESPVIGVTVDIYQASITTSVNLAVVYLGGSLTFSGTLQFANGTPLTGYDLQIWWGGTQLTTITISDPVAGAFSYVHPVDYGDAIGIVSGYALFEPPTIAWGTTDTIEVFNDVTVIERVDVFMDPEPVPNTITRGDTLIISGDVLNDGGFAADGATVEALVDGSFTGSIDVTAGDGSYSISLQVPLNQPRGSYIINVTVTSTYHELRNGPIVWTIIVLVDSRLDVSTNLVSRLPGESFRVDVALTADDGGSLDGEWVSIYLGSTYLTDVQLTDASGMTFQFTVPLTWSEDSGFFDVSCEFGGTSFVNPSTANSSEQIHVFTDVVFSSTPSRVDPGQAFVIECSLRDPAGNPIMFRNVWLNYNQTDVYPFYIQDDGRFQYNQPALPDGSFINFRITLISPEVDDIVSGVFRINIQTTGGNPLQGTDLLIASILLVGAVIAVLAYLYIVRGMFRSTAGITRGFDIPTKLRNIKKLADAGKYGASITLAYRTFEQMCGSKMGSERTHSETAREYLDRVLQTLPLDSATVEQFVQTYEEARFSHHEMTRERYEEAVRIFTDLYPRIDSATPIE